VPLLERFPGGEPELRDVLPQAFLLGAKRDHGTTREVLRNVPSILAGSGLEERLVLGGENPGPRGRCLDFARGGSSV
jgi:hypothetical protein